MKMKKRGKTHPKIVLNSNHRFPDKVSYLLKRHTQFLVETLSKKVIGVYVHGSLAMGGFTPDQSDIDYIVIVSNPLNIKEREDLAGFFMHEAERCMPAQGGVEMSIVLCKYAGAEFIYPVPYEFHVHTKSRTIIYDKKDMYDFDLAAHFRVIKEHGFSIYGEPLNNIFDDISDKYFFDSIARDAKDNFENIQNKTGSEACIVPRYAVLNFCRVLAFISENRVISKLEGAIWARANLPHKYEPIIFAALQEYRDSGSSEKVDPLLLKEFAVFSYNKVQKRLKDKGRLHE